MKLSPEGGQKTVVCVVAAVLILGAAVFFYIQSTRGTTEPDEATRAAMERSKQFQTNTNTTAAPDLPVEKRPPRGSVGQGK